MTIQDHLKPDTGENFPFERGYEGLGSYQVLDNAGETAVAWITERNPTLLTPPYAGELLRLEIFRGQTRCLTIPLKRVFCLCLILPFRPFLMYFFFFFWL